MVSINNHALIFIGIRSNRESATNGEVVKNQLLINRFSELFSDVYVLDLYKFKSRFLLIFLRLIYLLIKYPAVPIVLSVSSKTANKFILIFNLIRRKNVYYWVVGGALSELLSTHTYSVKPYKNLKCILVQGKEMVTDLHKLGLKQTQLVLNAKPIKYIPKKHIRPTGTILNFVFISRVSPGKGCDYIFEAVKKLNSENLSSRFTVTFYGKIESGYTTFLHSVSSYDNVTYNGFLDLQDPQSYDVLASYDAMLFPTYWEGEGFAGIFIDAFIAGLPVICSDWNCNSDFIDDSVGRIIPVHDVDALAFTMKQFINNEVDIRMMSSNCQSRATEYDITTVLSLDYLKQLGLISN